MLILDEPTAALGVKQAGTVLRHVAQARANGIGVIFITHNPHHAYAVWATASSILKRGHLRHLSPRTSCHEDGAHDVRRRRVGRALPRVGGVRAQR
ncbi:MAG: hypothetical protein R2838_11290 [Caldilineaceae bacterium]